MSFDIKGFALKKPIAGAIYFASEHPTEPFLCTKCSKGEFTARGPGGFYLEGDPNRPVCEDCGMKGFIVAPKIWRQFREWAAKGFCPSDDREGIWKARGAE